LVENAAKMFEMASGCKLHHDIVSKKCKILLLGSWKEWSQSEIPLNFLTKSEYFDMLGIKLFGNYTKTHQENGEIMVKNDQRDYK